MSRILDANGQPPSEHPGLVSPTGKLLCATPNEEEVMAAVRDYQAVIGPDGYVLKFAPHPKRADLFALFDSNGVTVGLVNNPGMASLICEALKLVSEAHRACAAEDAKADQEHAAELAQDEANEKTV